MQAPKNDVAVRWVPDSQMLDHISFHMGDDGDDDDDDDGDDM